MAIVNVEMPDWMFRNIQAICLREETSIERFLVQAAMEKVSRILGEEYLDERARRSSREAFERALAEVPDVPPVQADEL